MVCCDRSDYELAKYTPYLTLKDEPWVFFCDYFGEKLLCYEEVWLYLVLPTTLQWLGCNKLGAAQMSDYLNQ